MVDTVSTSESGSASIGRSAAVRGSAAVGRSETRSMRRSETRSVRRSMSMVGRGGVVGGGNYSGLGIMRASRRGSVRSVIQMLNIGADEHHQRGENLGRGGRRLFVIHIILSSVIHWY